MNAQQERQHQLNIETVGARPEFEELLDFAAEVCLRQPSRLSRNIIKIETQRPKVDTTNEIGRKLGLWGVRELLEMALEATRSPSTDSTSPSSTEATLTQEEEEALEYAEAASAFEKNQNPALRSPVETNVQDKIEAFGRSLLEEAFLCLGEDAAEKLKEFKKAKTYKEQVQVCNWLIRRANAIKRNGASEPESSDEHQESEERSDTDPPEDEAIEPFFYHPARLSPKIIGEYPENHVEPTCLGVSILVASFFYKAKVPYLHAGVAGTAPSEVRISQGVLIKKILEYAEDNDLMHKGPIFDALAAALADNYERATKHTGFHAAVLGRLKEDRWIQIDPNYSSNVVMGSKNTRFLDEAHAMIADLQKSARGVEAMILSVDGIAGWAFLSLYKECIKEARTLEECKDFLLQLPENNEEAIDSIVEGNFGFLKKPKNEIRYAQRLFSLVAEKRKKSKRKLLDETLKEVVFDHIFQDAKDKDIRESVARCKTDPNYLHRRAEDLRLAPFIAALRMSSAFGDAVISQELNHFPHSEFEIGSPEYRIGAAVLSDFAIYCGDELPSSFWLSYWPSAASLADHYSTGEKHEAQRKIAHQTARIIKNSDLRYSTIDSIISSILEQEGGD